MIWAVRGDVEPALATRLRRLVASHATLEKAMRDWSGHRPPVTIADVVKQDEFTHDVILPLPGGLALVYGSS